MADTKAKTSAKKPAAKKTPAKATTPKKAPVKKVAAKKAAPKKVTAKKKAPVKTAKKSVATTAKKAAPKKTVQKKQKVIFRIERGSVINEQLHTKTQDFEIAYDNSTTVLLALEDIKGHQDGTLTFRRSCRASICGSCGMFIDNRSRLACKTKVKDLLEGNPEKNIAPVKDGIIRVGPQKNQPVLKDLVVDIAPFYKKVHDIAPFVQDGAEADTNVNKQSFEQVNLVSNCIMCGSCYSDCTAMVENPDYLGPAALAKAFRFVADPREGHKTARLKELSEKHGVWDCTRCGMCIDACPKDVAPMEAIVKLREKAIENGVTNNAGARHAMAFKKDMMTWGVLNEATMLLKTKRLGIIGQIGNALNLMKKGKIPNPMPFDHKPEGLDEVKAIFKELEANPIDVATKAEDTGPGAG